MPAAQRWRAVYGASGGAGGRRAWGDGLWLALGTLTLLPTPMPSRVDRVVGGRAMVLAPIVGVLLGGIAAGVVAVAQLVQPDADLLAAVLAVLVVAGLSGALHLDGLADFADALGRERDRENMLQSSSRATSARSVWWRSSAYCSWMSPL